MSVLAHERFGKLHCGRCPVAQRSMFGCPYAVGEDEAQELGGTYTPGDRDLWPEFQFRVSRHSKSWRSKGCPWPTFVEDESLGKWVTAWELLKRFGKTPVDIGVWPKVTPQYLDIMLHLDRLSDEMKNDQIERENERMKRELRHHGA